MARERVFERYVTGPEFHDPVHYPVIVHDILQRVGSEVQPHSVGEAFLYLVDPSTLVKLSNGLGAEVQKPLQSVLDGQRGRGKRANHHGKWTRNRFELSTDGLDQLAEWLVGVVGDEHLWWLESDITPSGVRMSYQLEAMLSVVTGKRVDNTVHPQARDLDARVRERVFQRCQRFGVEEMKKRRKEEYDYLSGLFVDDDSGNEVEPATALTVYSEPGQDEFYEK